MYLKYGTANPGNSLEDQSYSSLGFSSVYGMDVGRLLVRVFDNVPSLPVNILEEVHPPYLRLDNMCLNSSM